MAFGRFITMWMLKHANEISIHAQDARCDGRLMVDKLLITQLHEECCTSLDPVTLGLGCRNYYGAYKVAGMARRRQDTAPGCSVV